MKREPAGKRSIFSRYFLRLLALSCVVGILPLALLGFLSYLRSSAIIQDEVYRSNHMILEQSRAKVEYVLQTVDTLATQMMNAKVTDDNVSASVVLRSAYTVKTKKLFESLKKNMVRIQVFELGIRDVSLVSFERNWIIAGGVYQELDSLDGRFERDARLLKESARFEEYRGIGKSSFWVIEPFLEQPGEFILRLVKTIPIHSNRPLGLVAVNIPLKEIGKRLAQDERLGSVLIADAQGGVIAHHDADKVGGSIEEEPFFRSVIEQIRTGAEPYFVHRGEAGAFAVTYDQSPYNGWIYISMTPLEAITSDSKAIQNYTLIAVLSIVALVLAVSVFMSMRLSLPVRRIAHFLSTQHAAGKSPGDELDFIGEQVQGMVRNQRRLQNEIRGLNRQAKEYFISRLLLGELKNGELEEKLEAYGYAADWERWCVFSIQIDTLEDTRYHEREKDLLLFAVHNMAEEIVAAERRLNAIVLHQTVCTLIGKLPDDERPFQVELYALAETIQCKVREYLGLKVSIGISRVHQDLACAAAAYRESLDALTYRLRLGHESILMMDEVQPAGRKRLTYPKELERSVIESVKQLDRARASEEIGLLIGELLHSEVGHLDSRVFLNRLLANLAGIIHDEGGTVHEVFPEGLQEGELLMLNRADEIAGWFVRKAIEPTVEWLERQRSSREVNITEEMLRMIRENYDADLTIEQCAARLNFHADYISRVFKKETGMTFSHALARHRLDMAKRWLRETDMRVAEISERLRYSHTSNFIRSFKKAEGVTPNQYREGLT